MKVITTFLICFTTVLCGVIEERKNEESSNYEVPNVVVYPVPDDVEKCFIEHKVDNGTFIVKYGKDWFYDDDLNDDEKICRFACYKKERMAVLMQEVPQGILDHNTTAFDEVEKMRLIDIDGQCKQDRVDVCKYLLCFNEAVGLFAPEK